MRCYCCDTHKHLSFDEFTGRFYCIDCFSESMEAYRELLNLDEEDENGYEEDSDDVGHE